ncbi:MAG: mechanosensitive ion channel family protein [Arcobacteraceae bacterium]|nr:mechanosensitive ion channel family protein [Arcobacteraceae bacterium]
MKILFIFLFVCLSLIADDTVANTTSTIEKNIWLKTYQNYKNYNILINNITVIEQKLKKTTSTAQEELKKRLSIYKSKLELYETNQNFNTLLKQYKYTISTITLRDFILHTSLKDIEKTIQKYKTLKDDFYIAKSTIKNRYLTMLNTDKENSKLQSLKEDLDYFIEYSENIEKTEKNLLESKEELLKKYEEYKNDIFMKHLFTVGMIIVFYIIYKLLSSLVFFLTHNPENHEDQKNYKKLLSLLFAILIIVFVAMRYIDDIMYIITFLSVIAAALTLATREIILNIAGAIYIFFTSIVKVGDRVMVQFETKHTIGDIIDISLVKMKLNEIEDYTNIKEIKNVGRTIYIPNSYIFTKVFYNYSLKKNGLITDLIEFEFDVNNNFEEVEQITQEVFTKINISYKISFNLNSTKTAIVALIAYQTNYKHATKTRGEVTIKLFQAYKNHETIKLKASKTVPKEKEETE